MRAARMAVERAKVAQRRAQGLGTRTPVAAARQAVAGAQTAMRQVKPCKTDGKPVGWKPVPASGNVSVRPYVRAGVKVCSHNRHQPK